MHEAKTQLSKLVEAACGGQEVVISKSGVPVVKLVPIAPRRKKRVLGQARGLVRMSADFNRPMSSAGLDEFLGS